MGLASFFKGPFRSSPENLRAASRKLTPEEIKEAKKRKILIVMASHYHRDRNGILRPQTILQDLIKLAFVPAGEFLVLLDELVQAGFLQRIDGGDKEKHASQVMYVISSNGLNELGLPG